MGVVYYDGRIFINFGHGLGKRVMFKPKGSRLSLCLSLEIHYVPRKSCDFGLLGAFDLMMLKVLKLVTQVSLVWIVFE